VPTRYFGLEDGRWRKVKDGMQFAKINGVTLHHQIIGATEGRPVVVFVNSLGTDFRIWRDVTVRLVGEFGMVLYDKRGHGLSDIGRTPYSIDDHVDDLIGLLEHLRVTNVIVCGLSVGGLIAQGVYQKRPDLVRALVLSGTAHKIGTAEMWDARIRAIYEEGVESIADMVLEKWFTPAFRTPDNAEFVGYRNMLIRTPREGYTATCTAIRDADFTEAAPKIDVPTICIVGDRDGSTPPALVGELAKLVPGALYQEISGAGHLPCIEQPVVMTDAIKLFIQKFTSEGK
jgi:3-oxoadipate enol-lactonase